MGGHDSLESNEGDSDMTEEEDETPTDTDSGSEQEGADDATEPADVEGATGESAEEPDAAAQADGEQAEEDDEGGISRRALLAGGAALGGLGLAAYLFTDNVILDDGPSVPFGVWDELQAGLRTSPDHLPATADRLVAEGETESLVAFVRDDIALQPPGLTDNSDFARRVNGGPGATLRAGIGTPREKAELLGWLLRRAGHDAVVGTYERPLEEQRLRELYFGGPTHAFDPDLTTEKLKGWASAMGDAEDTPEMSVVDAGGTDSATLADSVLGALPDSADTTAASFDYGTGAQRVPVVQFRERASDAGTEDGGDSNETAATGVVNETALQAETDVEFGASGDWQYVDLFHTDESGGALSSPDQLGEAVDPVDQDIGITLETVRMDAPGERIELVSGAWDARQLAGRQLHLTTLPGRSVLDYPTLTLGDVDTYVPALAMQDPSVDAGTRERLSVGGDPFTLTGERFTLDDTGTLRKDGVVVEEGTEEWDLLVETEEGEERTITPIESDQSVKKYYGYDTENSASAAFPDDVERAEATVSFLYRNTSNGKLSLVVVNDFAPESNGGRARMVFDGVGNYQWLAKDGPEGEGPGSYDTYQPKGDNTAPRTEANWAWNSGFTDGGAIGHLNLPFEFEITSEGTWDDGEAREGINRWVFLDGDPDTEIEVATFGDSEEPKDVTIRLFSELVSETEPTRIPPEQPTAENVAEFDLSVTADTYPEITVTIDARDSTGARVAEIPAGAVTVRENDEVVAAELVPTDAEGHQFRYRTPNREETSGERSVSVDIAGDGSNSGTYTVPPDATDPRTERGLVGLYLRLDVDDRTIRRTLAGWDPELDGDRDPTEADHRDVFAALWGEYVLSFETAGVPYSVGVTDELDGKLSLSALDDARRNDGVEEMKAVAREGHGLTAQLPTPFQPRLPNRVSGDAITYGSGLRTVLTERRFVLGEGRALRRVDALPTSSMRTLTSNDDRQREFTLTARRTGRRSVMEQELFETSTGSLLDGTTLVPASDATSAMADDVQQRYQVATTRAALGGDDFRLTAQSGETAAFWQVDASTGKLLGILPDGSGGGSGQEIIDTLEEISGMIETAETMEGYATMGPPSETDGVAKYYGRVLSRLYAIAAASIATLSTEEYNAAVTEAISKRVCNLADTITDGRAFDESQTSDIAGFMNNLHNAKDHTSSTCLQNDYS